MNAHKAYPHEQAAELLPWLVNGSLGAEEREGVLAHALDCVVCRRDMDELERFSHSVARTAKSLSVPAPDMRDINARIDGLIERHNSRRHWMYRWRDLISSPWRVAFAAQTLLIMVLATVLVWRGPGEPEFATLTQAQTLPDGHYLRVVFSPDLDAPEISILLEKMALTVADGPSERGVFTLAMSQPLTAAERAQLLQDLKTDSNVLFAQPVVIGQSR